jgi:hypothetical protein
VKATKAQLEEALNAALEYLEAIMGSGDFNESETIKHIKEVGGVE